MSEWKGMMIILTLAVFLLSYIYSAFISLPKNNLT